MLYMKKGILNILLLCSAITCHAAILKWDGEAADGQWASALNWDLDRLPGPGDEVILDNTHVTGNYSVFLPAGNVAVQLLSLHIIPGAGQQITCTLPSSNTASPAFTLTGAGDVFLLDKGAVFRNASGAASGTPVTVTADGFFRINNGGHYMHQTARGHTDYLVSRLSTAPGTEEGVFEFDVPGTASYTVSVSNRVFGRLIFSAASAGATRTYTGAGINPVTIRGDMEIHSNAVFSYGANTDTFSIRGNLLVEAGAAFNISNSINNATVDIRGQLDNRGLITESGSSAESGIRMNGTVLQSLSCTGSISQQVKLAINNPAGILLLTPLTVSHKLELIQGKVFTSPVNLLSLGAGSVCSGGSSASFIEGPVKKTGNTAFDFPVGAGAIYAPVGIGDGGLVTDEFMAVYKRNNPQSTPGLGNIFQPPINHISYVEYWELSKVNGSSSRKVKLSASPYSFAYNLSALVVARADNGEWVSEGGNSYTAGAPAGSYVTGTFISDSEIEEFGAFTLGSLVNQMQNPLPVRIESFNARLTNGQVFLQWRTGICPATGLRFEIEYSNNNHLYKKLATIRGNDTACTYSFCHTGPEKGGNYYRLRLIDEGGDISYSRPALIVNQDASVKLLRVPGIAGEELPVFVDPRLHGKIDFAIIDAGGRLVRTYSRQLPTTGIATTATATPTILRLPLQGLAKGIYFITGYASGVRANGGGFWVR